MGVDSKLPYLTAIFNNMIIFFEYAIGIAIGLIYSNTDLKKYKNNKAAIILILVGIMGMLFSYNSFGIKYDRGITIGVTSGILLVGVIMFEVKQGKSILLAKLSYPILYQFFICKFYKNLFIKY